MLKQLAFAAVIFSAWGWSSPQAESFLEAVPKEEKLGPNNNWNEAKMETAGGHLPISTTMQCVINLTIQYLLIFTALGISRTYCDMTGGDHEKSAVQKALKHASETVFYAPMACLMFIGFRMRVLQLTKGKGDPQDWARMCMQFTAWSILVNTILVLVVPIFTKSEVELDEDGSVKTNAENPFSNKVLAVLFTILRYLSLLALYIGFGGVIVGVYTFEPAKGVWDGPVPPVSPAVGCTVLLSVTFFMVYLFVAISRTYTQFVGGSATTSHFEHTVSMAANTMSMAPMFCVLFLGARMRALQMDPISGNPQRWAQNCFYAVSYALVTQTCVAVAVPLVLGGKVKQTKVEGDQQVEIEGTDTSTVKFVVAKGLTVARFCIMIAVYVGGIAVVCSVYTIKHPQGDDLTPPLSPTMQCVVNLATQYFFIYALLWIFITIEDFSSKDLSFWKQGLESAKSTVQFAPMLCVLFIITRMRALQMTNNKGAPQGWAQDGMYLASWALLLQFTMCLVMPCVTGKTYTPDSLDGSTTTKNEVENKYGAWAVTIVRYIALVFLYAGAVAVIVSVFLINKETANGRGSIPLVSDGTLGPLTPGSPPGLNDVPGAKTGMEATGSTIGAGANTVAKATGF